MRSSRRKINSWRTKDFATPVSHVAASRLLLADADATKEAHATRYPCVLKPAVSFRQPRRHPRRRSSPIRGGFRAHPQNSGQETEKSIQVEDFIPGREFALEGLVTGGDLQTLALFDKPDPLDGPFFEETIYLTPSRAAAAVQCAIIEAAQRAVARTGPDIRSDPRGDARERPRRLDAGSRGAAHRRIVLAACCDSKAARHSKR